ncbi:ANTAR domain-containing protein [Nocardia tengchongensis]|uniref:ANTAR domain-containing protein n=1 Tax=Nocardia tengchongensis TaxID=2055889 RepID=UPI0036B2781A
MGAPAELPEDPAPLAVVEQAKGVLMRIYRITADQAGQLLDWRCRATGIDPAVLARALIAELRILPAPSPETVAAFDHILLTVHHRISPIRHKPSD